MAAELRLGVSFDLVYFRQQLGKLSQIAASEFAGKVKLNIDKRDFQRQMAGLTKELRINVNDSQIVGARDRLTNLNKGLATFRRQSATPIVIKFKYEQQGAAPSGLKTVPGTFRQRLEGLGKQDKASLQRLYKAAGEASLLAFDAGIQNNTAKMVTALNGVGEDSIQGLLNGLKSKNADLKQVAKGLGESLIRSIKDTLGIASPSREFKKIGEDSGEGFEQGLKSGLGEAGDVGVREIEKLFKRLQQEAKAGSAVLQAIMAGAMSGVVQLPGMRQRGAGGSIGPMIRQQRAQVQAERQAQAGGLSALMMGMMGGVVPMGGTPRGAGGSIGPMIRQQRAQVQARNQAQTANSTAMILGMMSGVIPMAPRGAGGSISGLIQQERARARERNRPQRIAGIIEALSSASGNLSPAAGVNQRLFTGGAVNPGVLSSGYIGQSAISPKFLNYPAGMPPAYSTGFIEPTAFGSLAAGTAGRYGMTARGPQFPSSPMMTGGIGAGGGSFIPMQEVAKASGQARIALTGFTQRLKRFANFVAGEDPLPEGVNERRYATRMAAEGGLFGGQFVGRGGVAQSYGTQNYFRFPTGGMMTPEGITANEAGFRKYAIGQNAIGGRMLLGAPYAGRGGAIGNYAFPMEGMMGPSSPLGLITAQSSMFGPNGPGGGGGGGGGGRGGGFSGGQFNNMMGFGPASPIDFSFFQQSKFPLTGAIRELGEEFGTAVKQVLLFGTAYKALAFVTNLPGEALNAATALQTFRNQLEAVTGGTAQAEQAFAFVSDVVSQLNIPLESARAGFIRMYASMEPAGIAKGDIENLFVGISKAAATFGMSTDEVNRVTNAFAQMASKGQLSAEEVKNQLGDVMPGALSLFARAAQMDIGTFLKAMEDGAFKADAMGQVLRNVGKLLNTEYGGAAANAANTLQGALNGLTTAVKLMYESFEPLVSVAASTLFPQIETVVIDAAEAVKAFAAGMQGAANPTAELSSNGLAMYGVLGQVVEIAKSLEGIITGELGTALVRLGGLFLTVTEYITRFLNTGLGQWLTRITIEVGLLTAAWGLLSASGIIPATVALLRFVATLNIAQLRVYIAGIMSMVSAFLSLINTTNLAKVALLGFKTVVLGAVGAGVLFAIDALVQRFMNVGSAIRDVAAEARRAKVDLDSLAAAGQLAEIQGRKQLLETELQSVQKAQAILRKMQSGNAQITQSEFETLKRTGLSSGINYMGGIATAGQGQIQANLEAARRGQVSLLNRLGDVDEAEQEASRQAIMASERNQRLEKITLAPGKEKKGKKQSMSDLIGGDIERWLDESLAALEHNVQTQLTNVVRGTDLTGKIKYGGNTEDAERMIKYAGQYQEASLKVLAIDETIKKVREQASALIANGIDPTEKLAALESKRKELAWEAATIFQKHSADAIVAAKKRDEELEKEKQKRMQIVELIEEAEVAAGLLSPLEAARRKQQRGFETNLAEAKKNGTPEQVARLEALQAATPVVGSLGEAYQKAKNELDLLLDGTTVITSAAQGFGDAFSKAFTDIITGAQSWKEGLGNAFKSVASMFADMVAQMLAKWAFMQIVGMFLPGGKAPGGQQPGLTAGINQYPLIANANGGVLAGGFQAFASGGVVTGPTLGLVGEGRFNEAVVPLPNGKSIPVDLGQGAGNNISTNIVVNMNNGQSNSQMSGRGGQALGRELEGAVRNVILKETRPGGLIYSAR